MMSTVILVHFAAPVTHGMNCVSTKLHIFPCAASHLVSGPTLLNCARGMPGGPCKVSSRGSLPGMLRCIDDPLCLTCHIPDSMGTFGDGKERRSKLRLAEKGCTFGSNAGHISDHVSNLVNDWGRLFNYFDDATANRLGCPDNSSADLFRCICNRSERMPSHCV